MGKGPSKTKKEGRNVPGPQRPQRRQQPQGPAFKSDAHPHHTHHTHTIGPRPTSTTLCSRPFPPPQPQAGPQAPVALPTTIMLPCSRRRPAASLLLLLLALVALLARTTTADTTPSTSSTSNTLGLGAEGDVYTFDTKVRTLEILKRLRHGDSLALEILDEHLPGNGSVPFAVAMKGWDGSDYTCGPVPADAVDVAPAAEKGGWFSSALSSAPAAAPKEAPEALEKKLVVLENTCALLNRDYWSYEWCHRKQIQQFHYELPPGAAPDAEPVRDPDWSLGKFVKTETRYIDGKKEKGVVSVVDYFEDGQRCDETGTGRKTAVEFYCCTADTLPRPVKQRLEGVATIPLAVAQLSSIAETSICNYSMIVCSPLLCDSAHLDTLVTLTGAAAESQALRLLEPLATYCLTRHEGYWSYEFCYKKSIRQYHTVAMRDANGRTVSKVESEYVIGSYQPVPETFKEEAHIVVNKEEEGGDPTYFALEYTDGTECDLTGEKRATTVQFVCGEGPTDSFVSIKEDRSCHYKAVVSSPRLCRHPSFRKERPSAHTVRCTRDTQKQIKAGGGA